MENVPSFNQEGGKELAMIRQALLADPAGFICLQTCERIGKEAYEKVQAERRKKRKRQRNSQPRCSSLWNTNWGRLLLDPESLVAGTVKYKQFRKVPNAVPIISRALYAQNYRIQYFPQEV